MHVLLIHQAFATGEDPGGTRHVELATRWCDAGHLVTVVASDVSYMSGARSTHPEPAVAGLTVRRVSAGRGYHRSFFWRLVSHGIFAVSGVRTALGVGRVDVVLGTSPPLFQAAGAWLVARLERRPFVLEVRDLWPEFAIGLGVLRFAPAIWGARLLERHLYRAARQIVVNSPAYRDHLIGKGVSSDKVSVIPNGVDPQLFEPDARGEACRERLGAGNRYLVVYAGALGMANDIGTIIDAAGMMRDLDQIRFVLVGDGKERPALEARVERERLANVVFVGARPKREIPQWLAAADATVATLRDIPEFRTTYPNKVFDYMAAGRPIVLAIDGVIRDVVERARCGLVVPPGDARALAAAVGRLEGDRALGRALGRAGRGFVVEHFHRDGQARAFLGLLEDVARR